MKPLRSFLLSSVSIVLLASVVEAQSTFIRQPSKLSPNATRLTTPSIPLSQSILDINNLWLPVRNDGVLGRDTIFQRHVSYPRELGEIEYSDALMWSGKVSDGHLPLVRTGGSSYYVGSLPGAIVSKGVAEDPRSAAVRVYRIRRDYQTADLKSDAAAYLDTSLANVTPEMVDVLRQQYDRDWKEWPWQKGAPFVDKNGNGVMDPGEEPGLQKADQVVWFVYNDLDSTASRLLAGSPPAGLEVQVTLWAYNVGPLLQDVVFKRYRVTYRGTAQTNPGATIDSMYLCQWADPEIGYGVDDFGGCDSVLNLGYAYNSVTPDPEYKPLGIPTPGVGYLLLQGPIVPGNQTDQGIFDFTLRQGVKNLPMTSFFLRCVGDGLVEPRNYRPTFWYWNTMRGFVPTPDSLISSGVWVDRQLQPTRFTYAGDPVTQSGWVDGLARNWGSWPYTYGFSAAPSDVRFYLSSGPFTLKLGETQEMVIATLASPGADGRNNTAYLKYMAATLRGIYPSLGDYVSGLTTGVTEHADIPKNFTLEQNYPNPFNPSTSIRYSLPKDVNVRLALYDVLGRELRVLRNGPQRAGEYSLNWDGRDEAGNALPSGVYFYRLETGDVRMTRKLILMR